MARLRSTNNAWRGFIVFLKTTHNAWVHLFFGVLAVYMGFILNISSIEWTLIVIVIALVIIIEMINTAIEIDINLTSPNYHPYAKDIKDVTAAAVLFSILIAGIVGIIIFLPKVIEVIKI